MTKIAILGFGVEGRSAYHYFSQLPDASITIFDQKQPADVPENAEVITGPDAFKNLAGFDIVVRSPSIPPAQLTGVIGAGAVVTSVTNEFLRVVPTKNIIGVTGSKGKGTTATLIFEMLKAAGKRVHLGGNIGVPALDLLPNIQPNDFVVLELSSFQLWDIKTSPHIAVVLMIEPEHQDVHASFEDYVQAKANIVAHQDADDLVVYLPENIFATRIANQSPGQKIPYTQAPGAHVQHGQIVIDGQPICPTDQLGIPGWHNVQNACAAVAAAWQYTRDTAAIAKALREFTGLPHRLKLVRDVRGVRYYDDSIATTPTSVIAAIQAVSGPKVLILGGADKGVDFTEMTQHIAGADNIRAIILIGAMREIIRQALQQAGATQALQFFDQHSTMADIVQAAAAQAQPGDAVVLSPACASFDMFKNYKDRGEQFIAAVEQLPQ